MFQPVDVKYQLTRLRDKNRKVEDQLISEAHRILKQDLFEEKKILDNLKQYSRSFEVIDEESVNAEYVFTISEIREIAIIYRLKFLDSNLYHPEIPYEAILKIKDLNMEYRKELRHFFILSIPESFKSKTQEGDAVLFVKTNCDNYFMIHRWGQKIRPLRKLVYFPLRNFETLLTTVLSFTLVVTLCLPTWLISLDPKAVYWSGYRAAAFFHLLIFNMGMTTYITFAFTKNFSSSIWNRLKDFD